MIRKLTAIASLLGVLALSMPGGACFLWAGLGVEHHHHGPEAAPAVEICVHDHDHSCAGHDHDPGEPERPCDPAGDALDALALATMLKVDPAALPAEVDFTPAWAHDPGDFLVQGDAPLDGFWRQRIDAPPPVVEVRFCRFLI